VTSGVRQELFVVLRLGIDAPEIVLLMGRRFRAASTPSAIGMILVL